MAHGVRMVLWCHSYLVWLVFEGSVPVLFSFRKIFCDLFILCKSAKVQYSRGTTAVFEDSPLTFTTVQLYVPKMSLRHTDGSMVSNVW